MFEAGPLQINKKSSRITFFLLRLNFEAETSNQKHIQPDIVNEVRVTLFFPPFLAMKGLAVKI